MLPNYDSRHRRDFKLTYYPSALLEREQYAARTIRPRLHARLDDYLVAPQDRLIARVLWQPDDVATLAPSADLLEGLPVDRRIQPVSGFRGGLTEARRRLRRFLRLHLADYDRLRNQAHLDATSALSPYLHFGHIGRPARRCGPSANSSIVRRLNAATSTGLRDETTPRSMTTCSSARSAPAFRTSIILDRLARGRVFAKKRIRSRAGGRVDASHPVSYTAFR